MQAPFLSQGLNRYSYVFNNPINLTDPSGFSANGEDSTIGFEGWGVGVTALAFQTEGTALGVGDVAFSLATGEYSLGDAHAASTQRVAAPTATARSSGANPRQPAGAASENTGGPKELARTQSKGGVGPDLRLAQNMGDPISGTNIPGNVPDAQARPDVPPRLGPALPATTVLTRAIIEFGEWLARADALLDALAVTMAELSPAGGFFARGDSEIIDESARHTAEQEALVDMAKGDKKVGISQQDAEAYKELGKEAGVRVRGPEVHPNRPVGKIPHIHVGPVSHIPVVP